MPNTRDVFVRIIGSECLRAAAIGAMVLFAGCKAPDGSAIKEKVDDKVYAMIDSKWQDEFGSKANYRIDSAAPSPGDLDTERVLPAGTVLTLPQAVAVATDHNRVYQLEKDFLYARSLDLRIARHQFDPLLFGSAQAGYVKDGEDEGLTAGAGFGFTKLLSTGTTIGLSLATSWVEVLTGDQRSGLASVLALAINQPLLRGSDPNIVLEDLTQAERDLLYQIRSFNRFRKRFVVSTITGYYFVLQAYDAKENARNYYEALTAIRIKAEKLAAAGRLPQFEIDQARQDELIAWDDFVQAEKSYKQALDDFKLGIGVPTETDLTLDSAALDGLRETEMPMPQFSQQEAIDTAVANRLDLANSLDAVKDAERKVLVALDKTRPGLDLFATSELKGRTDALTIGSPKDTAAIGIAFDPNLDTVAQENNYRFALIILEQSRRSYEEKFDTVVLDVREGFRDLAEAAERYAALSEQLALARGRCDNTTVLLQYGRANTRDVLDAHRDLYRAEDAATEALVDFTVATLRFYRDVEILQVQPDGMWTIAANTYQD